MRFQLVRVLIILLLLCGIGDLGFVAKAVAQRENRESILSKPVGKPQLVNDFVGVLSESDKNNLESNLVQIDDTTSNQIAVIITDTLYGRDISELAIETSNNWGIGGKNNNGILVFCFIDKEAGVKQNISKGKAFISVGYGLEDVVPDVIARRIIDEEIAPNFKKGDFAQGLFKSVEVLEKLTSGRYKVEKKESSMIPTIIIVFFIWVAIMFFALFIKFKKKVYNSSGLPMSFFLFGGGNSIYGNGFGGGSNGFGGGSSGFGGFGGGSFGGGGAGGSW